MTTPAIRVENLGKKYLIRHEQRERYVALRDVLTNKAKGLGRKIIDLGRSPVSRPPSKEEFWALKDVSFEVQPGERIGIIGRNGAGKSTLLKLLSRITNPSAGRIELHGRVGSLLEVGTGFHPELTGRENIFLNGAILGMSRDEIRRVFADIVSFAGIEKFLDTPVKRFSSGMYVRLAFAVAAHLQTELLLVDEVLAVGDYEFQNKCLGKMEGLASEGKTILFVSHNLSAIQSLCSRAILLSQGSIGIDGSTGDTVARYIADINEQPNSIISHVLKHSSQFTVESVWVNSQESDTLAFNTPSPSIEVAMNLTVSSPCRVSMQAVLRDRHGNSIGIFSPGHTSGQVHSVTPGSFRLQGLIKLPDLTKGRYFLDIQLTEPGVQYYATFPFAVKLEMPGVPLITGISFEQNAENGFLTLDGSVDVSKI